MSPVSIGPYGPVDVVTSVLVDVDAVLALPVLAPAVAGGGGGDVMDADAVVDDEDGSGLFQLEFCSG